MLTHVLFELRKEAEGVLKRERAAIAADDAGVWRVLWVRLWVRLKAWAGRGPPRWSGSNYDGPC